MRYYDSDTCELNKDNIINDLETASGYVDNDKIDEAFNMLTEITASLLLYNIDKR